MYRFEGNENERLAIEITRLRLGGRNCLSRINSNTQHHECLKDHSGAVSFLQFQERPWENVLLTRDCVCDTGLLPFRYISSTNLVEVVFQVDDMNYSQDYFDFFFEISYEFMPGMKCAQQTQLIGPGGMIALDGQRTNVPLASGVHCNRKRWFWQAKSERLLFLSTSGFQLHQSNSSNQCTTHNRILVYAGVNGQPQNIICPVALTNQDVFKLFSQTYQPTNDDLIWDSDEENRSHGWPFTKASNQSSNIILVIEFVSIQIGSYQLKWLELTPQVVVPLATGSISSSSSAPIPCPTWCPELQACLDLQLWCDGIYDCPSGVDESGTNCVSKWSFTKLYWYLAAAGTTFFVLCIIVTSVITCRNKSYEVQDGATPDRPIPSVNDSVLGQPEVGQLYFDKKLAVS